MYRPALVIGLGGTGVLTLRHLKAQLLASQERRLPDCVKLLALDTVRDKDRSAETEGKAKIAALRTELAPGEYHWVGGDVYDFVREVEQGQHPQIGSWFQARQYLQTLPRASFTLEDGAGQLRQFGRLAVFHDVDAPAASAINSLLNKAIDDIRRVQQITTLDVFLVASVAGGTGAGMFVDIAYLVRQIAQQAHRTAVQLKAFLVLPEAFSAIPGGVKRSMRARSFAGMRENRRFMVDFQFEHGYPMYYHASGEGGIWRSAIKTKLFDVLYHVDGQSVNNPLTSVLPELGVTAAIADAITAMLDRSPDQSEDVYARHTKNVMAEQNRGEDADRTASFDSALGTFSYILPMHHISELLAHRLAVESLTALLAPAEKDEQGYLRSLKPDASEEAPGVRGRDVAARLLTSAEIQSNAALERIAVPGLINELARLAHEYRPNDDAVSQQIASQDAAYWQGQMDPPGEDQKVVNIRNRAMATLNSRLIDDVPANQRGESPAGAVDRIAEGVERYKGTHLGREDLRTGQRVGGQYRKALDEYAEIHLDRFRLMLETESENILNGSLLPDDPLAKQRGGKLGHYLDFLDGVEGLLGRFVKALEGAQKLREERQDKQTAGVAARTALDDLKAKPGGLFGGRRRQAYLDAEQQVIDVEKVLIGEQAIRALVDRMTQHTVQVHESAMAWAKALGLDFESLYGRLLRGERQIQGAIAVENQVPVRQVVWDEGYIDELFARYTRATESEKNTGVDTYLGRLSWKAEKRRVGVRDEYGISLLLTLPNSEPTRLGRENLDRTQELLLAPARQVFAPMWQQESILTYLRMRLYKNGDQLAAELARRADVLLQHRGSTVVPANYLHAAHESADERQYLRVVQGALEDLTKARGKLNDVVNSSDRFALRLVNTKDLIPLDEMASYQQAELDYWSQGGEVDDGQGSRRRLTRETLHIFPAEVHAARFEARMGTSNLEIKTRALHNDVVLQMEDLERFQLFAQAWAYGLIRSDISERQGTKENYICLDLPERRLDIMTKEPAVKMQLTKPKAGPVDVVDSMMTWNYRQLDQTLDVFREIPYSRVAEAIDEKRKETIAGAVEQLKIDEAAISSALTKMKPAEADEFKRLLAENAYLADRQGGIKKIDLHLDPTRQDYAAARAALGKADPKQDAYIALYLAMEDNRESLDVRMRDILRNAGDPR
ncbi:MAG: hypothetical protein GXY76_22685 [Chloroflexi bacterium]|nr:hypothetical protein [Chloroflexota bacterium]